MWPQYFVFEWLLMAALLYYDKCYNKILGSSYFGCYRASTTAVSVGSTIAMVAGQQQQQQHQAVIPTTNLEYTVFIEFDCF